MNGELVNLLHERSKEKFIVRSKGAKLGVERTIIDTAAGHLAYYREDDKILEVTRVEPCEICGSQDFDGEHNMIHHEEECFK